MGLTKEQVNLIIVGALGVAVLYLVKKGGQVIDAGQDLIKPVTDPLGKAIAEIRYGAPGSGVQATESYVVLRQRDFDQYGTMKESAYIAASGMHSNNARILQVVLSPARVLREPYRSALAKADPIIITPDGKINTL